ncbi:MAG: Nramp family divalent metal transporter [Chloroflexi bacterium]|nr:Nramp family divalent metal transporter [Chloroflexota bacterium]MDA8187089.1 Nramp family divalent metal transporter [Dehalococcoidales bacterium]
MPFRNVFRRLLPMEDVTYQESEARRPSAGLFGRLSSWRFRLFAMLAVIGPGIITANADNDAGGISTYSVAGSQYGYSLLWMLVLITFSLAVTQEMGARTGAATGKGLAALIRERYGVRWTLFAMVCTLAANLATTIAEFAGVAAAGELFGVPRFVSVPIAAVLVWVLVVRSSYRSVEKVFLVLSAVYLAYPLSGLLVGAPWGQVIRETVTPSFQLNTGYILVFIATVGTTITPWGQFFIQSYVVDKGIGPREYSTTRVDVLLGVLLTDIVSFFIIVATASTIHVRGIEIAGAAEAAMALEPLAGPLARQLFAIGLLNASLLAASILPLATAYTICEAFGWEDGVDRSWREAPAFHSLYAFSIGFGALVALLPGLPLFPVMLFSQDVNGVLLAVVLVFAIQIASDRQIMGRQVNGRVANLIAWTTAIGLILLSVLLVGASIAPLLGITLG